jgi:hypothetical protein
MNKIDVSLTSEIYSSGWTTSRSVCFTRRDGAPGTHWVGGWLGPRVSLNAVVFVLLIRKFQNYKHI